MGHPCFHHRVGIGTVSVGGRQMRKVEYWRNFQAQSEFAAKDLNTSVAFRDEEKLRVVMAAGGTGGHVYPAIAIADEIRRLCHTAKVVFVGTNERMEWVAAPKAGYEISAIPAVPIRRPFVSLWNLLLPARLLVCLFACWKLLRQVEPHVVVGTGGYVSGPLCLVAAMMKYPLVVQEQNSFAGLTNRLLGRFAKAVFVAFSAAIPYFPKNSCVLCGNPIRTELLTLVPAQEAINFFFPQPRPESMVHDFEPEGDRESTLRDLENPKNQVVLVLGGSLGAKVVNRAVADMAITMLEENPTRYIIWQTGPTYYEEIIAQVGTHPRLAVFSYVNAMHMAYAAAGLVVARAGAITCSELLVTGKPSILIPSPNVAEDHQTKNAMAMAEQGTATVLPERHLSASALATSINDLLDDTLTLKVMSEKALSAATPRASTKIAEHILRIASQHYSLV